MKKGIFLKILTLMLLLQLGVVVAGAFLVYFHAKSDGDDVVLSWQTSSEDNVQKFVVERRTVNGAFTPIAEMNAKGANSVYSYTDETAYKVTDAIYIYRLKIVDNNDDFSYSSEVSVSHNVSSVKRTWGSIKALFR